MNNTLTITDPTHVASVSRSLVSPSYLGNQELVGLRPVSCDRTHRAVATTGLRVMTSAFICADAVTVNPTMATAGANPTNWFAGLKHERQRLKERSLI